MAAGGRGMKGLGKYASLSFLERLQPDPQFQEFHPNRTSRPVKSGHYVPVDPTPLPDPRLVCVSPLMLKELDLEEEDVREDETFLRLFSGNPNDFKESVSKLTWATPYALTIYGQDMIQNCPFGTGEGYGDGRAISVAEVELKHKKSRWEFQLKGAGRTPFCRGADGRAVLRSSVREFLASELMFSLGVSTTRALSLIVSATETAQRPWYSPETAIQLSDLENLHPIRRMMLMDRLQNPNVLVEESVAITCRAARSFLRVGQMSLFERRVKRAKEEGDEELVEKRKQELREIAEFCLYKEFPEIFLSDSPLEEKILAMLEESSKGIARLTADWIRVGFCQGNFNSDNCLVAGRTMDYGPFGFIEKFRGLWCMWTGGGNHFGFLNQEKAGEANFRSLCLAFCPLFDKETTKKALKIAEDHENRAQRELNDAFRRKLGLPKWGQEASEIMNEIVPLMESLQADYTIFWRKLIKYPELYLEGKSLPEDNETLLKTLEIAFYTPCAMSSDKLATWIRRWFAELKKQVEEEEGVEEKEILEVMRKASPKYVAREWMLVRAYEDAYKGEYGMIERLMNLFSNPYDEQPEEEKDFYRKAPQAMYEGIGKGGSAYMT